MNAQTRDVLPPIRFAVKLLVSNGIVRTDIWRDVTGIARSCGKPVGEEMPAAQVVNVPPV